LDPDSIRSVDLDLDAESGSGSRKEKMAHKNRKNKKFHVLKCWMFSLRAEGFSCSLDVLYGGIGISIR
jgi:hypothetical protein